MTSDIQSFYETLGDGVAVPDDVLAYPGMTTRPEKELLYRLAQGHYTGEGVIIDAGIFLGASTHAFARGIRDNAELSGHTFNAFKPVQSYDIAVWSAAGFDKYLQNPDVRARVGERVYTDGEDYTPLLEMLLADQLDLIEFKIGDIEKLAATDHKVEIAFYDCLKNFSRDAIAFKAFAPYFIPGKTIVVQQDYFYEDALDNKIRQEFLSPYFEFLGGVTTSAVFRMTKPFPGHFFDEDPVTRLSVDECIQLLRNAAERIEPSAFSLYALVGVARYMIMHERFAQAEQVLDEVDELISGMKLPSRPADVSRQAREWLRNRR